VIVVERKLLCDGCGMEIPIKKKRDSLGIEREYINTGKVVCLPVFNNYDMGRIGIHLCESCACKLSVALMEGKMQMLCENR